MRSYIFDTLSRKFGVTGVFLPEIGPLALFIRYMSVLVLASKDSPIWLFSGLNLSVGVEPGYTEERKRVVRHHISS
jgi:hypothetical protein